MDKADFYHNARGDLAGPLHGIRVLDVTTVWSGPMASCVLADLGADVVRVDLPGSRPDRLRPHIPGTRLSWFHETVNRNKRSVGLDLRKPAGRETFLRLVATADVVVENFRPGTLDRWEIGYERCRSIRPDVILVSVSGWGQWGSGSSRGGYDPVVQAASGWLDLNGDPAGEQVRAPTFLADDIAALHAAIAALAALRHRDRTGDGQHVDVAMFDALLFQSAGFPTLAATGFPLRRWGNETEFVVPANRFRCSDADVYLAVARDRHWRAVAKIIGRGDLAVAPGFARNDERLANRAAVNAVIAEWCATRTAGDVVAALEPAGVVVTRIRSYAEAVSDPLVAERAVLEHTKLSDGSLVPLVAPPAKFSRTPTSVRRGAPRPGQHTDEVLEEWGIDPAQRAI